MSKTGTKENKRKEKAFSSNPQISGPSSRLFNFKYIKCIHI